MKHLALALACAVVVFGCNKQSDAPPAGTGASGAAAVDKGQPKDSGKEPGKDASKDNSADVKAAVDRGLAVAKTGDKAKVSAWSRELVLPNAETWFKKVFGDELGKKVAAEYATNSKDFEELGGLLDDANKRGATEVRVVRVADASDREATGLQKSALEAMKKKGPLYTAMFCEPGKKESSISLWSFVVADGKPYLVGKMKAVK